jgi:pilus assembly protein CpaC
VGALCAAVLLAVAWPGSGLLAQQQGEPDGTVTVAQGNSTVVTYPSSLQRVSIGNPEVADAVVVSAREIVVNGKAPGTTTLLTWDGAGNRTLYSVQVTLDAGSLERDLERYFPGAGVEVAATGRTIVLSGTVEDQRVAEKARTLASQIGGDVNIIDNMSVPDPGQVMLRVRFAEVNRSAMRDLGINLLHVDPDNPQGGNESFITPGSFSGQFPGTPTQTFSDAVNFFLFHDGSNVAAFIRALQTRGQFRSLAEPNLMTTPGDSASFLAGGEFPYPVLQGGGGNQAVTIAFQEFGVRLNFLPTITNTGAIRLEVEPEVSSLDFTQGLTISGFNIPALLSRRAQTTIELQDGQTFAIAGLMDQSMTTNVSKVPLLGDIPILGSLFSSEEIQQNRTELLVLVTPELVRPGEQDEEPAVPTGEPETWDWFESMHMEGDSTGTDEG